MLLKIPLKAVIKLDNMICPHCNKEIKPKRFKFVWRDGKEDVFEGNNVSDAFTKAGYGGGAMAALDYYKELEDGE